MKIKINSDHEMKSVSTTLINDNKESVLQSLTHKKYPEQSVSLEVFDLPLNGEAIISKKMLEKEANQKQFNQYEVKLIKSLAVQDNNDLF
jgi:Tfp pilus assembly ATPase PilU